MKRISVCILAATLLLGPTDLARASTFDPSTGRVSLDPDGRGWDLDDLGTLSAELPFLFYNKAWDKAPVTRVIDRFVTDQPVIEGEGALAMGAALYRAIVPLPGVWSHFAGRRVAFTFWQKPQGTRLAGEVSWYGGDVEGALASGAIDGLLPLGSLPFQATGRVTDDGWREMSTGPVDFELGGTIGPAFIMLNDVHAGERWENPSLSYDDTLRVLLDAFDIVDLGPAQVGNATCNLATEASACGAGSVCRMGRCVESGPMVGPMILDAGARRDYVERRLLEFSRFDGSREAMRQLAGITMGWATLVTAATPERFWPVMAGLVDSLRDGHATAPSFGYGSMIFAGGACLTLGDADLLEAPGTYPLVINRAFNHPLGGPLKLGDALTAVDGMPIFEWWDLAAPNLSFGGDPAAHDAVTVSQLLSVAMMVGSTLTFERCPASDVAGTACARPIETLTIDLAPATEPFWQMKLPLWLGSHARCDYRLKRVPQVTDPAGFATAASADQDGVRHLLFNGFPSRNERGGNAWFSAFENALGDGPARVVVDERQGYGGTADAMNYATSFFLGNGDFDHLELYPNTDLTLDATRQDALRACLPFGDNLLPCGYFDSWSLRDTGNNAAGSVASSRVALLLTSDVSGNDFFTKMLTFRAGPLRIFGPAPTWGAFGPIVQLPAYMGESAGGSFQIQDTVFFPDLAADPLAFSTGTGVPPDEIVMQKQSDALAGIDTLLEAAITWAQQ